MADRLVSVDDNFDFPPPVEQRQGVKIEAAVRREVGASGAPALAKLRAALATRNVAPVPIVFSGSSTTEGVGASQPSARYVNVLTEALHAAYPMSNGSTPFGVRNAQNITNALPLTHGIQVFNVGIGGASTTTYIDDYRRSRIVQLAPRAMFHMVGSNDNWSNKPAAAYKADLEAVLAYFKQNIITPCVHILIHQHLRWDRTSTVAWSEYGEAMRQIAEADPTNVAFIDVSKDFETVGVPNADPLDLVGVDNIHLTDAGHAFMADLILQKLGVAAPGRFVAAGTKRRATSDAFTGSTATTLYNRSTDAALGGYGESWKASAIDAFGVNGGRLVQGAVAADSFAAVTRPLGKVEVGVRVHSVANNLVWLVAIRDALSGPQNQVRVAINATTAQIVSTLGNTGASHGAAHPYTAGQHIGLRVDGVNAELLIDGKVVESQVLPNPCPGTFSGIARSVGATFSLSDFTVDSYVG